MNIEQLNAYIENKEPLDQKAISQIMLLIEKNPYFQIAHMLLLKAMYNTQPEKYNGQLKISASFISDKKKLYQFIHETQPSIIGAEEKKTTEKIEKIIEPKKIEPVQETKNQEKTQIIKEIPIKTVEKIDTEAIQSSNKIETEKTIKADTIDVLVEKTKTTEELIKKPETKKKVDLPDEEIEKLANQNSEIKHKKIVSDFFHNPSLESPENKILDTDQEQEIEENKTEQSAKKEFPNKEEIKNILEEKKKNIISRNEPIITKKEIIIEQVNNKIEKEILPKNKPEIDEKLIDIKKEEIKIEEVKKEELVQFEKKVIPVIKKKDVEGDEKVVVEKITERKIDENKSQENANDTMSNIFSKIRQIKKEMNIESSTANVPIDLNKSSQNTFIDISSKTDDKKGRGKIIKESFIGFNENEIKKEDLISSEPINIEKPQEKEQKTEIIKEEIKSTGITAKDLFKQHLQNKDKEPDTLINVDSEVSKSPISKVVEKLNQTETDISIEKEEAEKITVQKAEVEKLVEKTEDLNEVKTFKQNEQVLSTSNLQEKSTAADELLKRIADKKRKMQEEREKEEQEKLLAKEKISQTPELEPEKKSEPIEIKNEKTIQIEEENIETDINQEIQELPKEKKSQYLIDSFIEKVDSLERLGSKETKIVGDISEKSTEENEDFMTETMADLYVQQKNYQKAIEIYNKLILKFPEKKTYFAIQIKKTESLIK
jgi:hypothetical protein